ncbi:putative leucine-rich repeat domain superfamily [Helianthus anomalus]
MQTLAFFLYIGLLFIFSVSSFSIAVTKIQYPVSRRGLIALRQSDTDQDQDLDPDKLVDPSLKFENPRIKKAYCALQEWKKAMISDPLNMTGNWVGPNVCSYYGVGCVPALDDEQIRTVAAVDLNFGDISGQLVPHLGLLADLGILHLHSNRFCGIVPKTFSNLELLFELDLSNNRFSGLFPTPVLTLPSLRFLDIRFNEFEGPLPPALFDKDVDAIVVNNNRFSSHIPKNMGNSPASTVVLSNNKFSGCIPRSIGRMPNLEQVSFSNNRLTGCLPEELGMPKFLNVLDVSKNYFLGPLPKSLERMEMIERLDVSSNHLTGKVHDSVCGLSALWNLTIFDNYFNEIGGECEKRSRDKLIMQDRDNCFSGKPNQRSQQDCSSVLTRPVDCKTIGCQPRDPLILELNKRKPPLVHSPSPPDPQTPKVTPTHKTPQLASPTPPVVSPPPARAVKNFPPKIGSQHSSPPRGH